MRVVGNWDIGLDIGFSIFPGMLWGETHPGAPPVMCYYVTFSLN
jgi:hypothetical protein